MNRFVFVHEQISPFDPARSTELVEWREEISIVDLMPKRFRDVDPSDLFVVVNARSAREISDGLLPGDHVTFALKQDGLDPVSVTFLGKTIFEAAGWLGVSLSTVGNLAIAYLVGRLIAPPPQPQKRSGQESLTYQFAGPRANRSEGTAIPIVYGKMRFAGTVIAERIDYTLFNSQTTYNALILLGHGPIYAVGGRTTDSSSPLIGSAIPSGIQIDGNDAKNFEGIEVEVRLGSLEQEPAARFHEIPTNYPEMGFELLAPEDASPTPSTAEILTQSTYSDDDINDAHFTAWSRTLDMDDESDRVEVLITFPNGLMRIDGSGSIQVHTARFIARYIELDGGGVPISTGGPDGDGYVRLPPMQPIVANKSGSFTAALPINLYDPQTYSYISGGEAAKLPSTTAFFTKSVPVTPGFIPGTAMSYTWLGWIGFETGDRWPDGVGAAATATRYFFELTNGNRGIKIGIARRVEFGLVQWHVEVAHGDGTSFEVQVHTDAGPFGVLGNNQAAACLLAWVKYGSGSVAPLATGFRHIGVRLDASEEVLTVFINGVPVATIDAASLPLGVVSAGSILRFAGIGTACPGFKMDESRLFSRALEDSEIIADYNAGNGILGEVGDTTLQAGFHLGSTTDYSGNGNTLVASGGATFTSGGGGIVLTGSSAQTKKRGRYRIELARNSADGTHERVFDKAVWSGMTTFLDEALSYPGCALVSVRVTASEQLSGTVPDVSFELEGRKVPVWNGISIVEQFSQNPAWIALDVVLNTEYGLGYPLSRILKHLPTYLAWANYCDHLLDAKRAKISIGAGASGVNLFYGQDPTTFEWIVAVTDDGSTENLSIEEYTLLGKPQVGDFIAFSGVPVAASASPAGTSVNTVDGAQGFTPGSDPSVGGGLEVIRSEQVSAGQWKLFCRWPGENISIPWTQNTFLSSHATLAGTVRRQERRFAVNGVIDTTGSAWDRLLMICAVGRGAPVKVGDSIRIKFDAPREPVDLVSMASIVENSFEIEYTGPGQKPNVLEAEILDEWKDWDRTIVPDEHPSIQDPATFQGYRPDGQFLWGVTSHTQAKRFCRWQLNLYQLVKKQGRFRLGPDGLAYEPGDVLVLGHDLVHGATSGMVYEDSPDESHVTLDTDIYLATVGVWEIQVRDTHGSTRSVGIIDATVHVAPITIPAGSEITLSTPFSFIPEIEDRFIFTKQGEDLFVQVTSASLAPNLERSIEWMQYLEEVYDDNSFDDIESLVYSDSPRESERSMPLPPKTNSSVRMIAIASEGGRSARAILSWTNNPATRHLIAEVEIYIRRGQRTSEVDHWPAAGEWSLIASLRGAADTASVMVDVADEELVEFAARPVNSKRRGLSIASCIVGRTLYAASVTKPIAPVSVEANVAGEFVKYVVEQRIAQPGVGRSVATALRRGGWILGQQIVSLPWGVDEFGPTRDWAGASANSFGEEGAPIYAARVTHNGVRSEVVSVDFEPEVDSLELDHYTAEDYQWEDYGTGWTGGGFIPAPALVDCVATADWTGRKFLEFTGSALSATYTTVLGPALSGQRAREVYCEAVVVAEQVHPMPMVDAFPFGVGAPESDSWTVEGPTTLDAPACKLWIEISVDNGATWANYKPGVYVGKQIKFRMLMTRPNAEFNVRVYRFATRVRRVPFNAPAGRRSDLAAKLHAEIFNG